jgi:hypothetical protein
MWVGLGGYKLTSPAVEQVGTELDCVGGHPSSSAWYELAPSASHRVRIGRAAGLLKSGEGRRISMRIGCGFDVL